MATDSSLKNRANMISKTIGQDKTNSESGESMINTKDETIIRSE